MSRVCVITLQHRDILVPDIMFAKREASTLAADDNDSYNGAAIDLTNKR